MLELRSKRNRFNVIVLTSQGCSNLSSTEVICNVMSCDMLNRTISQPFCWLYFATQFTTIVILFHTSLCIQFLLWCDSHKKFSFPTRLNFLLLFQDVIYRLRFYSNSLIHILLLSNSHNKVASIQKNRGDKLHGVIVAIDQTVISLLRRCGGSMWGLGVFSLVSLC